jgi:hypothetical protein
MNKFCEHGSISLAIIGRSGSPRSHDSPMCNYLKQSHHFAFPSAECDGSSSTTSSPKFISGVAQGEGSEFKPQYCKIKK